MMKRIWTELKFIAGRIIFRKRAKQDLNEELRSHLEFEIDKNIEAGMAPDEARYAAQRAFGRFTVAEEESRRVWGGAWCEELFQDARYNIRVMKKNPGFTTVAILTLAIGIGASTAMFGICNAILFKPLPFSSPDRLVWVANNGKPDMSGMSTRVRNYLSWKETNTSFEEMGAYYAFFAYTGHTMTGIGDPEKVVAAGVTQSFLNVLGVQPELGRGFTQEECKWNGAKALILTNRYWKKRFAADTQIIGRAVTINRERYNIVGVLPSSFDFSSIFSPGTDVNMLVPFPLSPETDKLFNSLFVIGRLKPGITINRAQTEMSTISKQLMESDSERGIFGARLVGLHDQINGSFKRAFLMLLGAVGCVLLIACVNISNLLLARSASQSKEIALHKALGASRARVIRRMLTESLLLSLIGALIGLPFAYFSTKALASAQIFTIPLLQTVNIDMVACGFAVLVSLFCGIVLGFGPAFYFSGADIQKSLKDETRGNSESQTGKQTRRVLVISEITLAVVLLVGAGLLTRSFQQMLEVDMGFRPEHVAAWRIDIKGKIDRPSQVDTYLKEIKRNVKTVSGVESVGMSDTLPLGPNYTFEVFAKGEVYSPKFVEGNWPLAYPRIVDESYLQTMRIPLLAGRFISEQDTANDQVCAAVINSALAKRLWPNKTNNDIVGLEVRSFGKECKVVGMAGNVRHISPDQESGNEIYFSMPSFMPFAVDLVVRSTKSPESIAAGVRSALLKVDPLLPTSEFKTLDGIFDKAVSPKRFIMLLLVGFSAVALALAAIGIYGVLSYSITQRTNEIGIRMALGADRQSVLNLVATDSFKLVSIGLVSGLIISSIFSQLLEEMLFNIKPFDLPTLIIVPLVLFVTSLFACWLPVRRAVRVDPMIALRSE